MSDYENQKKIKEIYSDVGNPTDSYSDNTLFGRINKIIEHFHGVRKIHPYNQDPIEVAASGTAWADAVNTTTIIGTANTIDNAAATDAGGGIVTIPATGHKLQVGYSVKIDGTTNYDGVYVVEAITANDFNITATYVAETFAGTETATDVVDDEFDIHWINVSAISANGNYELIIYSGDAGSEVEVGRVSFVRNAVQSQETSLQFMTPMIAALTRISARLNCGNNNADTCKVKVAYHTY